jgi:hypothetical protein
MLIPLRSGVDPAAAREAVATFLSEWTESHWDTYLSTAGAMVQGKITLDEAQQKMLEDLEDSQDEFAQKLPEILDRLWDFSQAPGGPIGSALEALDGPFWESFLGLARDGAKWLVETFTVDDLDRKKVADRLTARAVLLELRAAEIADGGGSIPRVAHLRRVAARKRDRAATVLAKIGG